MTTPARSLLDPFVPPEGLVGHTAVLVTMTADPDVLDDIMTRFSGGLSARARAREARRIAYLMRDPGSWDGRASVLRPGEVPGMHELRPTGARTQPRRLMHAKLALLTFSKNGRGHPTLARLLVTTGNFTRASLKHQLELAFVTEARFDSEDDLGAGRADVKAAAKFVRALADRHYEAQAERASGDRSPLFAFDAMIGVLAELASKHKNPRFFHSLEDDLFLGLRDRVEREVKSGRNLLVCASGFVEQDVDEEAGPKVLEQLASLRPMAKGARKVLLVPPETTGQLREWSLRAESCGWEPPIHAHQPLDAERRLHAKYVLFGRQHAEEHRVLSGHLYLGSGNLSRRGMTESGPGKAGNVECGVFFELGESLASEALEARLFWSEAADVIAPDEWVLRENVALVEIPPAIENCPILHALVEDDGSLSLVWSSQADAAVRISVDETVWTEVVPGTGKVRIEYDVPPSTLHVANLEVSRTWQVPVIDEMGRYAWMRERLMSVRELLAAVKEYPLPEGCADDDLETEPGTTASEGGRRVPNQVERTYDLLYMATFIETVARKQEALAPEQIDSWLEHLERMRDTPLAPGLLASWPSEAVGGIRHLLDPALAPPAMLAHQRRRYRTIVEGIARRWGLQ